mgnify:CR=1 FL=1
MNWYCVFVFSLFYLISKQDVFVELRENKFGFSENVSQCCLPRLLLAAQNINSLLDPLL